MGKPRTANVLLALAAGGLIYTLNEIRRDNMVRDPIAVSRKTPEVDQKRYVKVSSGEYIVTEFDDRYEVHRIDGVIPSFVEDMTDFHKDGVVDKPKDRTHQSLYDEIHDVLTSE